MEEFASCSEEDRFKDCVSRRRKECIVRFIVLLFRGMFRFKMIQYIYCNISLSGCSEFIFPNAHSRRNNKGKVRVMTWDPTSRCVCARRSVNLHNVQNEVKNKNKKLKYTLLLKLFMLIISTLFLCI